MTPCSDESTLCSKTVTLLQDGVLLDMEGPGMSRGDTNTTFKDAITFGVCELKRALNKTLEGNMLAWTTNPGHSFDYHAMSAGGCLDYFLDMFYWCIDYEIHAVWRNRANSPYDYIDMPGGLVDAFEHHMGVSPDKFGVIFPFFACSFACSGSGPNYHGCPNVTEGAANAKGGEDPWRGAPYIGEAFDFILPNAIGKPWLNTTTQTNVVNYHDGAGDLHQLWYDDAKTYAKKMEAVKQRGVRALGIWQAEGAGPHPEVTEALWAAVPGPGNGTLAQKMDDGTCPCADERHCRPLSPQPPLSRDELFAFTSWNVPHTGGPQPLLGPDTLSGYDWEKITVSVPFGAAAHRDPAWPGAQPSGNTSLYDETYCKAHVRLIAHPESAPEASEAWLLSVGKRRARARVGDAREIRPRHWLRDGPRFLGGCEAAREANVQSELGPRVGSGRCGVHP